MLDADPALRAGLAGEALALARAVVLAPVDRLEEGPWWPEVPDRPEQHLGFLLLDGILFRRVVFGERDSAELLGPGDLLRPWQRLRCSERPGPAIWTVVEPASLAVLDERFTRTVGRWPQITAALVGRALDRARALAVMLAIAQMPGVELRLLTLLWHLVERFGRRDQDRSVVPIRLTHQMLAALVRSQRPTVRRALTRLVEQDLVSRRGDGSWILSGEPPLGLRTLRRAIEDS